MIRTPIWFDIDGTLLHTRVGKDAFRFALHEVYGWEEDMATVRFAGNTDLQVLMDMNERHQGELQETLAGQQDFFERMAHHMDVGLARETPERIPGAKELLQQLHQDPQVMLGLITGNAKACAFLKLKHADLHADFRAGGYGDEHADRNVLADRAVEAARKQLDPEHSLSAGWLIGDTPRDMAAAQQIGAKALGVASGSYTEEELRKSGADEVVENFLDLDWVRALLLDTNKV